MGVLLQLKKEPHFPLASYQEGKQLPFVEAACKGIYIYVISCNHHSKSTRWLLLSLQKRK